MAQELRAKDGPGGPGAQLQSIERQRNEDQGRRERDARESRESRDRQVREAERQRQDNQRDAQRRQAEVQRDRDADHRREVAERQREDDRRRGDRERDRGDRGGHGYQHNDDRPQGRPHLGYSFRDEDNRRLRDYYRDDVRRIEPGRRPVVRVGTQLAPGYQSYLRPVPYDVYGRMPAPPPGYQMGYYQGHTVVYDPTTSIVLSALDLVN